MEILRILRMNQSLFSKKEWAFLFVLKEMRDVEPV